MKIKNILVFLILFTQLIVFFSCSKDKIKKEKITIPSATFSVSEEVIGVAVDEKTAYLLYTDKITTLDLESGIEADYCETEGGTLISAEGGRVCVYSAENEKLTCYENGAVICEISYSLGKGDADILKSYGNTAVLGVLDDKEDISSGCSIYYFDLKSGKVKNLGDGFKKKDSYSLISDISMIDENNIAVISYIGVSTLNQKVYLYDVKNETQIDNYLLDHSYGSFEYSEDENSIYGIYNLSSIVKTDLETMEKVRMRNRSDYSEDLSAYLTFDVVGNSAIMWTSDNEIVVTSLIGSGEPLVIYIKNALKYSHLQNAIADFEAKYDIPVRVHFYYNNDMATVTDFDFDKKLKTKLMAKDEDFDLFYVSSVSNDIYSMLKNNAYEPLEKYEQAVNGFGNLHGGVREMMTYDSHIFGVPLSVNISAVGTAFGDKLGFDSHGSIRISNDDLWQMCEKADDFEKNTYLLGYYYFIQDLITPIIQDALDTGKINRNALTETFEAVIKHYNEGFICFDLNDGKDNLLNAEILLSVITMDSIYKLETQTDLDIAAFPIYEDKVYHRLNDMLMMNPSSGNKQAAVNFLAILMSEPHIYNSDIYNSALLGKDLTKYPNYENLTDVQKMALSSYSELFKNSRIITFSTNQLTNILVEEIYPGIVEGTMTGKEAADRIAEFIEYTYFE